jgi:hypothetical protein
MKEATMIKGFVLVTALLLASPAAAFQGEKPAKPVKEICKWIKDTQWRTARARVCMPREKWQRIARETQKEYNDYARSGSFGSY